ncbi:SDR family oxidoreductase [Schleiferiaceae bacterium]|nr:SDR family oxidoreductase [Schleiferiaceae bacterium]
MLEGKNIIVTGGNGLLGREICNDIQRKGGNAINFDVHHKNAKEGNYVCDITNPESIGTTLNLVELKFGEIHGLVNNAYPRTKDWGTTFEDLSYDSLQTNVNWQMNSYLIFCKLIIPYLRKSNGGSVVNMTSIYGVVGNDFTIYEESGMEPPAAYSAIKGGLINATRFLASKYGKECLRFNCVSPGGIFDYQPTSFVNAYEKKVPMKRMGNPDDIAPAVSFLLSDESKYITGHNLIVDGGWTSI